MRSFLRELAIAPLAGFLLGASSALFHSSRWWPELTWLAAWRGGAIGWLLGWTVGDVVLAPLLWARSRRARPQVVRPSSRWSGLVTAGLLAAALAPGLLWLTPAAPIRLPDKRPNLVLITIDALRTDHLGAYGSKAGLTPNLDAFAKEASRYDAAYASSPWTLNSFGALFTSLPPSECGLKPPLRESFEWYKRFAALPADMPLLSERLRPAGYATAAELTNPFLASERGWSRGFDSFRNEGGKIATGSPSPLAELVTRRSLEWLRLNRRKPFLFWVHYLDLHVPYQAPTPPPPARSLYPRNWVADRGFWEASIRDQDAATRARYRHFLRLMYQEEVRYADRWVGELLKGIKSAGLWNSSLIVISTDHGETLLDRGAFDHGESMHGEVLSVPLLVKWPRDTEADRRMGQVVALASLGTTFLAFAHSPDVAAVKAPPLPRRNASTGEEVYSEGIFYGDEHTSLTTDSYRVIYHPYAAGADLFEVYDRRRDPEELKNLAGRAGSQPPVHQDVVSDLCTRLKHLTDHAQAAAEEWWARRGGGLPNAPLPESSERELRSMGYVGR